MTNKAWRARAAVIALTSVFLFLGGCSVPFKGSGPATGEMDPDRTNEDIREGPGLFTGEEGGFVYRRGQVRDVPNAPPTQTQTDRLSEQSREFDRQIEELERQRRELELLKEELKQILRDTPRPQ